LQYQPVLNLVTGEIDGLEALARLASDEYGAVAPDEFIPIAEKTRLILPLGDLIFTKALDFWNGLTRESKLELNLSVNVSVLQFLRRDFTRDLLLLIKKKGVAPSHIILEITESVLVNNYDDLNRVFAQLKGNGIRIAIDDFGTGYSSLARERELNVNYLKIDKFFIEKLLFSKPEDTLSENIISMGHKLGHCVVAEGVEHECQLEYLKENGCDKAQGFYISRPLDENEVGLFLRNWKQGGEIHPE
jgi:EAL domain-containing protein (putative c-di-GMP-specific phosphodiesterase class I)